MQIDWLKKLWNRSGHHAFTDLCIYQQGLVCCFREASTHISGDGRIRVLKLSWQGQILASSYVQMASIDLRDPKLSVDPKGRLLLLAYARENDQNQPHYQQSTTYLVFR